jgi:hypothetical protein
VLAAVARVAAVGPAGKPTLTHARAFTNPRHAAHPRVHVHARLPACLFTEPLTSSPAPLSVRARELSLSVPVTLATLPVTPCRAAARPISA